ncbi:MAG TPA: hypothetical protein P5040_03930 [Smithella sp.]|nr:hypothetical protein [Smithella sp.]
MMLTVSDDFPEGFFKKAFYGLPIGNTQHSVDLHGFIEKKISRRTGDVKHPLECFQKGLIHKSRRKMCFTSSNGKFQTSQLVWKIIVSRHAEHHKRLCGLNDILLEILRVDSFYQCIQANDCSIP